MKELTKSLLLNKTIIIDLKEKELKDDFLILDNNNIFIQKYHFLNFLNKKKFIFIKKNIKEKYILDERMQGYIEEIYYRNIIYYMILINTFNISNFQKGSLFFNYKMELIKKNYENFLLKDIQDFIFNEIVDFSEIQNRILNTILVGMPQLGEFSYYLTKIFIDIFNKNKTIYLNKFNYYKEKIKIY